MGGFYFLFFYLVLEEEEGEQDVEVAYTGKDFVLKNLHISSAV